jgi:hypothetical protein
MRNHRCLPIITALIVLAPSPAIAQDKLPQVAPGAQKVLAAATPKLPVPPAEKLVLLIRLSLLTLNDAIQSGNYTVLRDRGGPSFRQTNSAASLSRVFASLEAQRPDLAAVAILAPQLTAAEIIGPEQRLHVTGHFPGLAVQIGFDLTYEPADGQWQLFGISVGATPVQTQAAASPPAASKKTIPPAQAAKPVPAAKK